MSTESESSEFIGWYQGYHERDAEIERLRAQLAGARQALVRIDAINDNPACFDAEIDDLCASILRLESQ